MTAFSRLFTKTEDFECELVLSSVNSRYLEITVKTPDFLGAKRWEMENLIKEHLLRGKVTLQAKITFTQKYLKENVAINGDLIRSYFSQIDALELPINITIGDLMKLPHAVENLNTEIDEGAWDILQGKITELIGLFLKEADREGARLGRDLKGRLQETVKIIASLEKGSPGTVERYRELLLQRIEKAQAGDIVDEARLYKEVSLFAESADFTEEVTRLKSHCDAFSDFLAEKSPEKGKKISFLLQEMNREINTIGSKCRNSDLSLLVVNAKEELEKMREQIQNVW